MTGSISTVAVGTDGSRTAGRARNPRLGGPSGDAGWASNAAEQVLIVKTS